MSVSLPVALQLCAFAPPLEQGLAELFELIRWFDLGGEDQAQTLARRADEIVAVATGGHIGCPPELMAAMPNLGIIAINGVGYDKVDLAAARDRGIRVTTTPDVLTADVADLAVGLTIDLLRGITHSDRFVRDRRWPSGEWPLSHRVTGRSFGIVGLGRIGRATADRLAGFGPVRYFGRSEKDTPYPFESNVMELARWADVLVVACAANAQTHHLINAAVVDAVGPGGFLVNVSRGSVVDQGALIEALERGAISGAALDVFADEPRVPDALLASQKVVLTPHIASATFECRRAMADIVLANLKAFLCAQPLVTAIA